MSRSAPAKKRSAIDELVHAAVTVGYLGRIPVAPGSFGALPAIGIAWGLQGAGLTTWVLILVAGTAASVLLADRYLVIRNDAKSKDPQEVVLDELLGCLIALAFVPFELVWVAAGYVLFRAFDILKPGP
ncbi:MAG: phosphatidylglycerophosphatase A, partial [Myxococcota bacterium]